MHKFIGPINYRLNNGTFYIILLVIGPIIKLHLINWGDDTKPNCFDLHNTIQLAEHFFKGGLAFRQ